MFKNRSRLIAMLLLVSFLLTGCWDATDVSSLNLCTMVILDKKGEEFTFIVEIAQIMAAGESGGGPDRQTYLTGSGASLAEARDALDMQMDKPLFLGTVRTLIVTERAAENDLPEYLFRLRENQAYRQKVNISIIQEEPLALTEAENETNQPLGFVIDDTILTGQTLGHTCAVTTEKYINSLLAKRGFIIQHIGLQGKQIALDGYSVFRDGKLAGFIPIEGSRGLTYLLSKHPVWVYRLPGDGGFITSEVELSGREIQPAYQDGQVAFQVHLEFKATIQSKSVVDLFPLDEQVIQRYCDDLRQVLALQIRAAIDQSQSEFQSDYLYFGDSFRLAFPDEFDQMDWPEEYLKAEIETTLSIDISVSDKMAIEAS